MAKFKIALMLATMPRLIEVVNRMMLFLARISIKIIRERN